MTEQTIKLAIVAYPGLDAADRAWIESIRARHDPSSPRIDAHFTLVFPVDAPPSPVVARASAVASLSAPIAFTLRHTPAIRDVVAGGGHVSLVADEGRDAIAALHDRLYEGVLRAHLREDIPFVPHVTLAAHPDVQWCEALAQDIDLEGRVVRGRLERIDLVHVSSATRIQSLTTFALGGL